MLAWVVGVICMGFLGMLAWVGGQMVWRVRFQTLPSLEISISWVYLAIPVGASLAAIAVLARLLDRAAVPSCATMPKAKHKEALPCPT